MQLRYVQLALPAADHDGCDAVSDQVCQRPAFAHDASTPVFDHEMINGVGNDNNITITIKNIIVFKNPSTTINTIAIADLGV
jgi:hypothetical protein